MVSFLLSKTLSIFLMKCVFAGQSVHGAFSQDMYLFVTLLVKLIYFCLILTDGQPEFSQSLPPFFQGIFIFILDPVG